MNIESIIEEFKAKFNSDILETVMKNQKRIIITMRSDSIINVATYLFKTAEFRFIIASALHTKK